MHSWRFMLHTFSCWRTRSGPPGVTPPARSRRGRANKALLYLRRRAGRGMSRMRGPHAKWLPATRRQNVARHRSAQVLRSIRMTRLSPHGRAETLHQSRQGEGRLFVRLPFVFLTSPRSQLTSPVKGRVNLFLVNIVWLCVVSSTIIKEK